MVFDGRTHVTHPRAKAACDCRRCGFEGKLLGGRLCERCTLTSRLTALLDDGTGRVRPELRPLFDLLVATDKPGSGLAWLEMRPDQPGNASQMLRQLGLGQIPLTHDAFHELQPRRAAGHLEELLMASGVLPSLLQEYIAGRANMTTVAARADRPLT